MKTKNIRLILIALTLIICMCFSFFNADLVNAAMGPKDVKIKCKSGIVMDYETGAILYEKNPHKKIYPASTTKVLTAIVAIENSKMTDVLTVSENALKSQEDNGTHVGLKKGEKITMKDALYSMMLESANDSAIAIAEGISGSEENFSKLLNAKVKELDLKDSNFVTPNGLFHNNHYTTAYDMAKIIQYAYKNEEFRKLYSTNKYVMAKTNKRKELLDIYTTHRMSPGKSKYYKYAVAGKTGFLRESKCNLSTVAKKGDMTLICYVATNNSIYDICDDTEALFENSFKKYKHETLSKDKRNKTIKDIIDNSDYQIRHSKAISDKITVTVPKNADLNKIKFKLDNKKLAFPIEKGDITGHINAIYENEVVGNVTLIAKDDMTSFMFYLSLILKILLYAIIIGLVLLIVLRIYFKSRKKRKSKKIKGYSSYKISHKDQYASHKSQNDKNNPNYHRKELK